MKMTNNKPNFQNAYNLANEILITTENIIEFPYDVKKLVSEMSSIKCRTYKKALEYGVDISFFGSKSANLVKCRNKEIIFYNQEENNSRVKFSILHEFGHNKMNHKLSNITLEEYTIAEIETNYFSAQLLMPEQIIRELQKRGIRVTKEFLVEKFRVSNEAAQKRLDFINSNTYRIDKRQEFDDIIISKFNNWLDGIAGKNNLYENDEEMQKIRYSWM